MAKPQIKTPFNRDNHVKDHEVIDGPSMTVPEQTMSLRTILTRHASGLPMDAPPPPNSLNLMPMQTRKIPISRTTSNIGTWPINRPTKNKPRSASNICKPKPLPKPPLLRKPKLYDNLRRSNLLPRKPKNPPPKNNQQQIKITTMPRNRAVFARNPKS